MKSYEIDEKANFGAEILFVSKEEKRMLFLQRSEVVNYPLQWCLPGGMGHHTETSKQAAIRECAEETGNKFSQDRIKIINTKESYNPKFTFYTFVCVVEKPFQCKLSFEHINYVWSDMDNLPVPLTTFTTALLKNKNAEILVKKYIKEFR